MPLGNDSGAAWDEAVDPILKAAGIEDEKERNEEVMGCTKGAAALESCVGK
jgi:hypothetical protein